MDLRRPSSPGMLNTPVSSEDSAIGHAQGHASGSPGPSSSSIKVAHADLYGRRSTSFDTQRSHSGSGRARTGSGSGTTRSRGGSVSAGSIARMDHPYARSPLVSAVGADDDDDIPMDNINMSMSSAVGKATAGSSSAPRDGPPAPRLPVDRLPSPPLTPVASRENMRKPSGKGGAKSSPRGEGLDGVGDENNVATNKAGNGHSELSTWFDSTANSAPGSDIGANAQEDEDEDEEDIIAFAQPLSAGVSVTSFKSNRGKDLPARPPSSVPPLPTQGPSSSSQTRLGTTGGNTSPQPWDLVDPPPGNNSFDPAQDGLQMQMRVRNQSLKSTTSGSRNLVVKNGRKYRIPRSSYYFGPPADTSAYGTDPIGHIGVHHPREIVRIERDYSGGELVQFSPAYPLELEGRITPTQFLETINTINESLIEAHSLRWSFFDNALAFFTLYISRLLLSTYYERRMRRLQRFLEDLNRQLYNPQGLNILWPKDIAFMFLEIEYY